ncbi:hypothetical protein NYY84_18090 [Acinetobacter baumannii]|nr:hypothetical protein [Acinetobacter baumannii]
MGCAVDFVCRLLHLKIISLKKPLQIGLCNKAATKPTIGLKGDKGLYATAEWWENIKNGNIETYCVKGVIVGINQENPFIEENTMITIKVNGMNKEIFQDIVFTSEREKTISKELYKAGNEIVSIYILDKLKEDDVWNWVVEEKLGVSPLLNRVYIKGRD